MTGKVIIVTGGASGIGLAIARRLSAMGAQPVIADIDAGKRQDVLSAVPASDFHVVDVADVPAVRAMVGEVADRYGRIDGLIHCAGIVLKSRFLDTESDAFDRVMAINLRGTYFVGQAVARVMARHGGGRIVNIGSVSGDVAFDTRAAYGSSKAAVHLLTKVMAAELAPHDIVVNAVAPGPVETPLVAAAHDQAYRDRVLRRIPSGRYADADDIASVAVWLIMEASTYLTGQSIAVDGGFTSTALPVERA
ncbi:MAG: SDR family NAD(P)-dependent oxidoreductase [Sphingobium sp.]